MLRAGCLPRSGMAEGCSKLISACVWGSVCLPWCAEAPRKTSSRVPGYATMAAWLHGVQCCSSQPA